jgi:hypothetical protein
VHHARRDAQRVQGAAQVASVIDGHAEGDRAAIAGQLLNRARHQRVALFDIHRLRQLVFAEILPARRQPGEIRQGRDAKPAQRREIARLDQVGQRSRVDDALEHLLQPLAVAASGRGRKSEQRARPTGLERAQLPQHAQVVVRRRVVAFVVNHQPQVASLQHLRQPLFVQRADRANQHLGLLGGALAAALDGHDVLAAEGVLQLLSRLLQQLLAMRQYQHLPLRELSQP